MSSSLPSAHEAEPATTRVEAPPWGMARPSFELFLISFLVLFLELACIRWLEAS